MLRPPPPPPSAPLFPPPPPHPPCLLLLRKKGMNVACVSQLHFGTRMSGLASNIRVLGLLLTVRKIPVDLFINGHLVMDIRYTYKCGLHEA